MGRSSELAVIDRLFRWGAAVGDDDARLLERFRDGRDEAAFAALVDRHGPMVLGVCRRVLRDDRDVEDAFQATFLILARRAATIRGVGRVGPWLHGVAHRVATRARADSARRFVREGVRLEAEPPADDAPEAERRELRSIVDDELRRLPCRFRDPVVLCHLEGLTHDQAADRLRLPVGTVRSRLARARTKLRDRLERRGLSAADAPALLPLAEPLPPALLEATLRSSLASATAPASTLAAAGVVALADGVLQTMILSKTKLAAVALGTLLTLGGASGYALQQGGDGPVENPARDNPESRFRRASLMPHLDGVQADKYRAYLADMERSLRSKRYQEQFLHAEIQSMEKDLEVLRKKLRELEGDGGVAEAPAVEMEVPSPLTPQATKSPPTGRPDGLDRSLAGNDPKASGDPKPADGETPPRDVKGSTDDIPDALLPNFLKQAEDKLRKAKDESDKAKAESGHLRSEAALAEIRAEIARNRHETLGRLIESARDRMDAVRTEESTAPVSGGPVKPPGGVIPPASSGDATTQTAPGSTIGGRGAGLNGAGEITSARTDGIRANPGRQRYIAGPLVVIVPSSNGRVLTGYSLKHGWARSLRIAPDESDVRVDPIIGPGVATVQIKGAKVERIAAFSSSDGEWHPQELREPTDQATPQIGPGLVAYPIGRLVYAFGATTNRWDVLEPKEELKPWPVTNFFPRAVGDATPPPRQLLSFMQDSIMCQDEHQIHIFSGQTGTWTSIEFEAPAAAEEAKP